MPEKPICILCGSLDIKIIFKEGVAQIHQIVKCQECGLMFAFPIVSRNIDKYRKNRVDNLPLTMVDPPVIHLNGFVIMFFVVTE